jgi:hypothetical protein
MAEIWPDHSVELDEEVAAVRAAVGRPWVLETVHDVGYRLGRPPARPAR